jgi:glycosyltransferase involved in cell wall biosynthesis
VPVVCLLQDEHEFLDVLSDSHAKALMETVRSALAAVSLVVSVSHFYDKNLAVQLDFEPARRAVVYPGVRVDQFPLRAEMPTPPALGFLSRWSEDKAPHRLAEAYMLLKGKGSFEDLQLHFCGGWMVGDEHYIKSWRKPLAAAEEAGDVTFTRYFDQATRQDLFGRLHLLVVTESAPPAFRRYVLEALATGVTVVAPPIGVFKELEGMLAGGLVLCDSEPAKLADCCAKLLQDPAALQVRGGRAHLAVHEQFQASSAGVELAALLANVIDDYEVQE